MAGMELPGDVARAASEPGPPAGIWEWALSVEPLLEAARFVDSAGALRWRVELDTGRGVLTGVVPQGFGGEGLNRAWARALAEVGVEDRRRWPLEIPVDGVIVDDPYVRRRQMPDVQAAHSVPGGQFVYSAGPAASHVSLTASSFDRLIEDLVRREV